MKIGPRYKKARYLGAPVFRKTQTQKYSIRSQKKTKSTRRPGGKSEYGRQMLEKQKARYGYGVSAGQFAKYVKMALRARGDSAKKLLSILEGRLDNVILRSGFAPSRSAARQMVSHGHIAVNGVISTIPSMGLKVGDRLSLREGSKNKGIFVRLGEELEKNQTPSWIKVNVIEKNIEITGEPVIDKDELLFDVGAVLEFYTR